jgi:hypothetical protein
MATRIYGPDAFVVGSDTLLDDYDPDWVQVSFGGGTMTVNAANDRVQPSGVSENGNYRWTGQTVLEQRIQMGVLSAQFWTSMMVRTDTDNNGYLAEWDASSDAIILYRATGFSGGAGGTWTEVAQAGGVAQDTEYTNAYLKATGTNPVEIRGGDDTNGADILTYDDTNAARHQSGQPGVSMNSGVASSSYFDDVEIWDEAEAPWPPEGEEDAPETIRVVTSGLRF